MNRKTMVELDDDALAQVVGGTFRQGSAGNDSIYTGASADVIFAGGGNDVVYSGAGNDQVYGEGGADVIHVGSGGDIAYGGAGHDTIDGGSGSDRLYGEDGDDSLDGGAGDGAADQAFGGAGQDSFIWAPGDGNDVFDGGAGRDTLMVVGLSVQDLQAGLALEGADGLRMQVTNGAVSFIDAAGNPATFSGTLHYRGETLRFADIEKIQLS